MTKPNDKLLTTNAINSLKPGGELKDTGGVCQQRCRVHWSCDLRFLILPSWTEIRL